MLNNTFFTINGTTENDNSITTTIELNAKHTIFEGHFPNNPVTPGVVQLQLVKEILAQHINKPLVMKEVGRCKFLAILNPIEHGVIDIKIDYKEVDNFLKVSASGTSKDGATTFFKFSAKYC